MAEENTIDQAEVSEESLMAAISNMAYSEYSRLQDFLSLTQKLKEKQDALDIMSGDTTPSAIGSSYVADTLEPNSQGDLVTLVAKTPAEQIIINNIYKQLNIPLEKVVYSLFKNAIAVAEFAHEADLKELSPVVEKTRPSRSANESVTKSATEDIFIKVHNSKLCPKIRMISDTTRIFPILHYETVIGYIELTLEDLGTFDMASDMLTYKDVVIHSAEDFAHVKFGFRTESKPLILKIKMEDDTVKEYEIEQGRSLLEASYPAWQTLSIMRDSINLARLAFSASSVVVQTEVGNMSDAQIELSRNKLKDIFENRLAFGRNGAKSYLQPQVKPNYIYAFTNQGVGGITTSTVGGDYNPGVLSDLRYFEDEFFGGMGAVKQHFARTEDAGGLDGGAAVEEYEKRYKSYVSQFRRLLADFIKQCINKVLLARELKGVYNNFDVLVNKCYEEDDLQVTNHQQTKLSFLQSAIEFLEIEDPKKLKELKLQILKSVITDKNLTEAFSNAVLEEGNGTEETIGGDEVDEDLPLEEGGGGLMSEIGAIGTPEGDLALDLPDESSGDEEGGGDLPSVDEIVPEEQIDQPE